MSTSVTTTRIGLISDLRRTLPVVELQRHRIRVATRLSLCRDSVVCITATQSRPNNFQLRTELLRCQDRREIQARILAVELSRSCQDRDRGRRTTACKALMSKRRASCIENSAAFSFDERQPAWKTLRVSHFPTASTATRRRSEEHTSELQSLR